MYYYHLDDAQVVGSSPEILVRQEHTAEGTKITIRPLAGTRPRGATPEAKTWPPKKTCWPTPRSAPNT
jgi:anthranilate synthase component I